MTCRKGKEALERKSGIRDDERQRVMVRLAAWWRNSNLVILVTLMKGTCTRVLLDQPCFKEWKRWQ